MVWIKISNIDPLSRPRMLNEFRKALTNMGDSVKLVRSYAIVLDPGYR